MGDRLPVQRSAGRLVPRNPSQGRRDCPSTIQLRAYFARLGLPPVAGTPPPEPFTAGLSGQPPPQRTAVGRVGELLFHQSVRPVGHQRPREGTKIVSKRMNLTHGSRD
jgi:hypothetical protein